MEKINGYAKAEAEQFVEYMTAGKRAGKTLTALFAGYGKEHGRACGSVRNYYYRLLKTDSAAARGLLKDSELRAETVRPFTDDEKEEMLQKILLERGKGTSVRRAIANVCGGDEKKMLRYQNKFRNMLKKQPDEVRAAAQRLGISGEVLARHNRLLERRLENEINALYDRLALSLREENERLREQIRRLQEENEILHRAANAEPSGPPAED